VSDWPPTCLPPESYTRNTLDTTYPRYTVTFVFDSQTAAPGTESPRIPQRRAAEAHDRIREMILVGRLAQGSVLSEAELVRQLGMSRTPVREALHRLEAAMYVRPVPGIGYVVIELSELDMINVYRARAVLEGLAAENAATSATRTDLGRLEDLFEEMACAGERGDDGELSRLNGEFHRAIADAGRNSYVLAMLDNIRDVFERLRATALTQPRRREASHAEHRELIAALQDRDAVRARELALAHALKALEFQLDRSKPRVGGDR
jgi:DNA-binding GntR family transcriptional regulator